MFQVAICGVLEQLPRGAILFSGSRYIGGGSLSRKGRNPFMGNGKDPRSCFLLVKEGIVPEKKKEKRIQEGQGVKACVLGGQACKDDLFSRSFMSDGFFCWSSINPRKASH